MRVHVGVRVFRGLVHELAANLQLCMVGEGRIAQGVGDGHGRKCPVGAPAWGNGDNGGHVDHRHLAAVFDCFGQRCTATRTGASGGGQDYCLHPVSRKSFANEFAPFFSVVDGGAVAGG